MFQSSFIGLIALILITGRSTESFAVENDSSDDGAIGYTVLTVNHNTAKFEIAFLLGDEDLPDCKNSLLLHVTFAGFNKHQPEENTWLEFGILDAKGQMDVIYVKSDPLSQEQIQVLTENADGLNVHESRDFVFKKGDYKKLATAKAIKYKLKTNEFSVEGVFPQEALMDVQKFAPKLLARKCIKMQTPEESEQELKKAFSDFEGLKAGATKAEIEKHFGTQFTNKVKDPDTGAYEEIVMLKAFGSNIGPIIIGFDVEDKLIYTRDPFNKTKISYFKTKH